MNLRSWLTAPLLLFAIGAGSAERDPKIGLVLIYEAKQPTQIVLVGFDEHVMLDARTWLMYISPNATKQNMLSAPRNPPREISAVWRYEVMDPADEASPNVHPDWIRWREARGTVPLRSRVTAEELKRLHEEPKRHRLHLRLMFDRDQLSVRWRVEQWR